MIISRLLSMRAFRSSMGAILYDINGAYVESKLSLRLGVAVFIYWRLVHGGIDHSRQSLFIGDAHVESLQFFVVGVEPSHANSMSWLRAFTVTYAQYP